MPLKELKTILTNYNPQKFKVKEKPNSFQVIASTFKDLKSLANLCLSAFSQRPTVIEPERQFLLLRDWNYFDCFCFFEGSPIKSNKESFPKTTFSQLPFSLHQTVSALLEQDPNQALNLIKSIALSKTLNLPPNSLPETSFLEKEIFLENMLFKNSFPNTSKEQKKQGKTKATKPTRLDSIEVDFSQLWALLLTQPFYNLGFESIDCDCCKPNGIFDRNTLPHSIVECNVLSEGLYFKSLLSDFADQFHESNELKENRNKLIKEFFLNYTPVGPFRRNQKAELLLCDAVKLCDEEKAELLDVRKMHWFCLEKESFLSKELKKLNSRIVSLSTKISKKEKKEIKKHNLLAETFLAKDLDFLFKKSLLQILKEFYCSIPEHLTDSNSRFFSKQLSDSIKSIQASTLRKFSELLKQHNGRMLCFNKGNAFIKTASPMTVLNEFSEREKLPLLASTAKDRRNNPN